METHEFDPYHEWLGISPDERPATHYRLLGVPPFESSVSVIESAVVRQSQFVRQFQVGPYSEQAHQLLNELNEAGAVLLEPAQRARYDEQLRSAQAPAAPARPPGRKVRRQQRSNKAATGWPIVGRRRWLAALLLLLGLAVAGIAMARRGGTSYRGADLQLAAGPAAALVAPSADHGPDKEPQTKAGEPSTPNPAGAIAAAPTGLAANEQGGAFGPTGGQPVASPSSAPAPAPAPQAGPQGPDVAPSAAVKAEPPSPSPPAGKEGPEAKGPEPDAGSGGDQNQPGRPRAAKKQPSPAPSLHGSVGGSWLVKESGNTLVFHPGGSFRAIMKNGKVAVGTWTQNGTIVRWHSRMNERGAKVTNHGREILERDHDSITLRVLEDGSTHHWQRTGKR